MAGLALARVEPDRVDIRRHIFKINGCEPGGIRAADPAHDRRRAIVAGAEVDGGRLDEERVLPRRGEGSGRANAEHVAAGDAAITCCDGAYEASPGIECARRRRGVAQIDVDTHRSEPAVARHPRVERSEIIDTRLALHLGPLDDKTNVEQQTVRRHMGQPNRVGQDGVTRESLVEADAAQSCVRAERADRPKRQSGEQARPGGAQTENGAPSLAAAVQGSSARPEREFETRG